MRVLLTDFTCTSQTKLQDIMMIQSNWLHSLSSRDTSYRDARSKLARNVAVQSNVQSCHYARSHVSVTLLDCAELSYADLLSNIYRELSNWIAPLSRTINFSLYIVRSLSADKSYQIADIPPLSWIASFYTGAHHSHDYTQSGESSFYTEAESSNYTEASRDRAGQEQGNSRKRQNLILPNFITNS